MMDLQKIKRIIMIMMQENEGHTEQGVAMVLMFISDVIQIGIGLLKRRIPQLPFHNDNQDTLRGLAVTPSVANAVKMSLNHLPTYILEEEEITEQVIQEKLIRHLSEVKFLGFDCEWVGDGFTFERGIKMEEKHLPTSPVALLQICTASECFLIRLSKLNSCIPRALREVLEDKSILKFGVGVDEDCKRLRMIGINLRGSVDIRFLIQRCLCKKEVITHPQRYKSSCTVKFLGCDCAVSGT